METNQFGTNGWTPDRIDDLNGKVFVVTGTTGYLINLSDTNKSVFGQYLKNLCMLVQTLFKRKNIA
ncbi:MAG: hypothetical protein CBB99_07355 [Bacteroidetes bacterium TMED39]|nr:MAG: hypothetical protein CBB99_07355 [Bacteroidetes bacterium TMED39]|tara:strand:+ start:74 stop:271 length:198 start_codon:yes stop_codon:yes gene_type:complete